MKNKILKAVLSLGMVAGLYACDKPYEIEQSLTLTQKVVNLKATTGSTPVIIYSNGTWNVSFTQQVSWAAIDRVQGYGLGEVKFSYEANYGLSRAVGIIVSTEEKVDTVMMVQAAGQSQPEFHFNNPSYTFAKTPDVAVLPFSSNIPYNLKEVVSEVVYDGDIDEDDEWISNIEIFQDSVRFEVAQNFSGADRKAKIYLSHTDAANNVLDTQVELVQGKLDPYLSFDAGVTGGEVNFALEDILVPVESNLLPYLFKIVNSAKVTYNGTEKDWIRKIKADASNGGVALKLVPNPSKNPRSASIAMTYTDGNGGTKNFKMTLTQSRYVKSWTFEEVKAQIAGETGSFTFDDFAILDAVVVGDKDHKNMDFNPMDPAQFNGFRGIIQDYQDQYSYIQAEDGSHGFRVKFVDKESNNISRYSKVKFDLKGVKVVKESNPVRYTLEGLGMDNIVTVTAGIAAKVKNKTISQLTDDDVFTYVSLKDMEIVFKRGAYGNTTDGYTFKDADINPMGSTAAFTDAYPLLLQDKSGDNIYMVTNTLTPWRRTGNGVPHGSGNISGILVGGTNDMMQRYVKDGCLGKYALRVLEEEEVELTGSRFSNVLVEWDWNKSTVAAKILEPTTGEGKLFCNISTNTGLTQDYNDLVSSGSGKGTINGACRWTSNTWWGETDADAPYFQIEFSTAEVTGTNLVYNWSVAQGNGSKTTIFAPAYWHIEYSTDGENFTKIDKEFAVRPIVWWANDLSLYAIPGLSEYSIKLPSSLFGQEKVCVRFIASSKVAATTSTPDGGTIQTMSGAYIRFGEMSVLYN